MNKGKTHAFFSWAAANGTVPNPVRSANYSGLSEEEGATVETSVVDGAGERRPDWVMKADDDSFIMLGELERRLRVAPRSKAFWGCEWIVNCEVRSRVELMVHRLGQKYVHGWRSVRNDLRSGPAYRYFC
jgi:hypothetical protein